MSNGSKWKYVGGELCLDFTNTVGGRFVEREKDSMAFTFREEKLGSYEDLVGWSREAGALKRSDAKRLLLLAPQKNKEAKMVFRRAVTLRESLFKVIKHVIEGWEPLITDVDVLNQECALARDRQRLVYTGRKFMWAHPGDDDALDCLIWPIALSGSELLSSEKLVRVRQCPGPDCGWLFVDTSKNQSRQWCDMKDCGNLAKVRRYRERQK